MKPRISIAPEDPYLNPPQYAHAVSPEVAKGLLRELYVQMVKKDILPWITKDDLILDSDEKPLVRYTTRWSEREPHKPHRAIVPVPVPGLALAKNFLVREAEGRLWEKGGFWRYSTPYIFTEEGAMVLKLSAYFNEKKNKNRQAKFEKALSDYNAARA